MRQMRPLKKAQQ